MRLAALQRQEDAQNEADVTVEFVNVGGLRRFVVTNRGRYQRRISTSQLRKTARTTYSGQPNARKSCRIRNSTLGNPLLC
jgi:hypothetical protein